MPLWRPRGMFSSPPTTLRYVFLRGMSDAGKKKVLSEKQMSLVCFVPARATVAQLRFTVAVVSYHPPKGPPTAGVSVLEGKRDRLGIFVFVSLLRSG